ncbi:MAG: FMN-binding glutamate synthase family protein [Fuerstiella sp.]
MFWMTVAGIFFTIVLLVAIYDVTQKKHAILRNFPVLGHFRFLIESVGPEFRQYIVASNDEERPFTRDQRSWVYASAKAENNYFGFGSDSEMERSSNYLIINHNTFPMLAPHKGDPGYDPEYRLPCAKVLGGYRQRRKAFRPASVVNISGMSYGSLSAPAVAALNKGAALAGCLQSTGEGGISPYHLHGGDLVWQIGTGYFGCRSSDGSFNLDKLRETIARCPQVTSIEIKLSQGAKPGAGGILPQSKITKEIAEIRGIPMDRDCVSPAAHTAFRNADGLLDFVEQIADETGLPVGIKSAVGQMSFWYDLARLIDTTNRAPDFITIDGGEGGTGAGPLVFADHVARPFKKGFSLVERTLRERGVSEKIVMIGSGKLGFPESALFAFALGCDMVNVAREAMLAVGCIQAQKCQTNHCPTGVATQNRWLIRGLDPTLKSARVANYVLNLRKEIIALSRACGVPHPALVTADDLEIMDGHFGARTVTDLFGYENGYGLPSEADRQQIVELMQSRR